MSDVLRSRARVREFWRARLEGLDHQRACARVGVSDHTGFGGVAQLNSGDQQPLTDLKV